MIRTYPDEILFKKCEECTKEDISWIKSLTGTVKKLLETHNGVGIAAPQLGYSKRFFWFKKQNKLILCINPKITGKHPYKKKAEEGCLSLPNIYLPVRRNISINVEYYDENWNLIKDSLKDMEARIFQHELDHLDGILILDRTEPKYLRNTFPEYMNKRKFRKS